MILSTLALLGLMALYLLVTGLQMRSAWHTVQSCTPQQSRACIFAWSNLQNSYYRPGIVGVLFVPPALSNTTLPTAN